MRHATFVGVCLLCVLVCARPAIAQGTQAATERDKTDKVDALGTAARQGDVAITPGASGDITPKGEATTSDGVAWSTKRGGPYIPTPVLYRDALYVCQNSGVLASYDVATGKQVYQQRLGKDGGSFTASPVAADGKLYLTSQDGDVFVVKAGPAYEALAANAMGQVVLATPAISDGVLFVRGLRHLFAIGTAKSSPRQLR